MTTFVVTRSSARHRDDAEQPCPEAVRAYVVGGQAWTVELDTLADLVAFVERNGEVIVSRAGDDDFPELEIYDDYRE